MSVFSTPQLCMTRLARAMMQRTESPALRRWVRNHFRKWCVDRELEVPTRWGFRMRANPRDYASYGIYFFGEYDQRMSQVVDRFVHPGQTVWDVGSERGWFTLLMAKRVGSTGRVDAFEPFAANADRLGANMQLNDMHWVHVHRLAVADVTGSVRFQPPSDQIIDEYDYLEHCSGVGFVTESGSPDAIEVPAVRLDDHARQQSIESLHFIKMDVEGAELMALRGAEQTIRRHRPIIAVEYNRAALRRAGTTMHELDAWLNDHGYERLFYRNGRFFRFDLSDWDDKPDNDAVFNAYCFHRDGEVPIS